MFGPSHAKLHQAANQAHGREDQFPWRRGLLGWLIPLDSLAASGVVVVIYLVVD